MTIVHVVSFRLPARLSQSEIKEFCDDMISLSTSCIHPESKQPYIVASSGGEDNSPENLQHGFTHAFVVEFASKKDRDYYVKDDPNHQAFVKKHREQMEDVIVVDYEKGVY